MTYVEQGGLELIQSQIGDDSPVLIPSAPMQHIKRCFHPIKTHFPANHWMFSAELSEKALLTERRRNLISATMLSSCIWELFSYRYLQKA